MSWLLPRLVVVIAAALFGGFVIRGALPGGESLSPLGAALGAAIAAGIVVVVDGWRGARLDRWLQRGGATRAPRDAGLWGDLADRVERGYRQRDQASEQLQAQLAQLLAAIEASPNGVLLLDAHGHIAWCSAVAAEHLGLDPARDVGQPVTNLVRAPVFVAHLQAPPTAEGVKFVRPGGNGVVQVLVRPYADQRRLVLTQDVTERERTETMRRDFVANVSHEIRTPLTVLAGFVETMATLPLTEVERKRVLQLMQQQTQRMQTLVSDLLTLAKIEGSPRPSLDHWVAVGALMRLVEAEATSLSAGRHAIRFDSGGSDIVAGSDSELVSALGNLVGNAVRYTPEGGRIDVCWRRRADGCGEWEVRDTGIGIAAEHLPRLTERFYRVDGSRSRDTGGTGLGLAIVKHIVQRHGGELMIDSEPGRGSVFRLVLPAARVRAELPATPRG